MKKSRVFLLLIFFGILFYSFSSKNESQKTFDTFFENKFLRIDYLLIGDYNTEEFVLKQLKKQNETFNYTTRPTRR